MFGVSTEDADFEGTHSTQFDSSFNSRHYFRCQTEIQNFDQNFHPPAEDTTNIGQSSIPDIKMQNSIAEFLITLIT